MKENMMGDKEKATVEQFSRMVIGTKVNGRIGISRGRERSFSFMAKIRVNHTADSLKRASATENVNGENLSGDKLV